MSKPVLGAGKWAVIAAAFALIGGCGGLPGGSQSPDRATEGDLAGARIGGPFTLTDQNSRTVRWSDFAGKYRLVYFGYTFCPDVCPLDLRNIMEGFKRFEKSDPARAARLQPMFITVDPERDTPAALKNYVEAFHPRLLGLTGPVAEIDKVKQAFAVVASKAGDQKTPGAYLVAHSRTPYLFGPDGKPIALVPIADGPGEKQEDAAEAVHKFLVQWVK